MAKYIARILTAILFALAPVAASVVLVSDSDADEVVISGRPLTKVESSASFLGLPRNRTDHAS